MSAACFERKKKKEKNKTLFLFSEKCRTLSITCLLQNGDSDSHRHLQTFPPIWRRVPSSYGLGSHSNTQHTKDGAGKNIKAISPHQKKWKWVSLSIKWVTGMKGISGPNQCLSLTASKEVSCHLNISTADQKGFYEENADRFAFPTGTVSQTF